MWLLMVVDRSPSWELGAIQEVHIVYAEKDKVKLVKKASTMQRRDCNDLSTHPVNGLIWLSD